MLSIVTREEIMNKQIKHNWCDSRLIVAGSIYRSARFGNDGTLGSGLDYWNGQKKSINYEPWCDDQPHVKNTSGLNLALNSLRKNKRHKIGIGFWNREKEINESTKGNKNIEGYVSGRSGEVATNNQSQCLSIRKRGSENYPSFVKEIEQGTTLLNF